MNTNTIRNKRILADVSEDLRDDIKIRCIKKKITVSDAILLGLKHVLDADYSASDLGISEDIFNSWNNTK